MNDNANSIDKKENIFLFSYIKLPKYNIFFQKKFIRFYNKYFILRLNSTKEKSISTLELGKVQVNAYDVQFVNSLGNESHGKF